MEMLDILKTAVETGASDIHIFIGKPPMVRIGGKVDPLVGFEENELTAEESKRLVYSILYEEQIQRFEENMELDSSFEIPNLSRFRVNVLVQKNGVEAVLRIISSTIPRAEELSIPKAILELTKLPRGLILVTGPTGSGKSTTLASLLDIINQERKEHILTIEDPIEYVYESKNCIVRQREVGTNTLSFNNALKSALRQDPDVILVGEMRDLETISLAISAAETGHLVFGTLHTQDAPQTIDRIVDVFPSHQQEQVRTQLATALKAVICQQLLPKPKGKGRVVAREIMIVTPAIANLIRESKTYMIYSSIETGTKYGMINMDTHLSQLVKEKKISLADAVSKAHNPEQVRQKVSSAGGRADMVTDPSLKRR
ncbi:MAG TPA: type IV pilus twitching motility protein PilT [Nitrospirae bacterium]|nr:twitching mobility protein [bacterium BMS3Abin09]GBE41697.1 twitching mobility protein [bacterium BMS3Bbin09]HDH34767.1 type IV pilus twitching motility protein PilT [Nitrospirota bacterium]HDZ83823.1 type IV pilus twitching motility protein PilT [Nitrospirota bacterium]